MSACINGVGRAATYQNPANWTVRDEFAAKALNALIGGRSWDKDEHGGADGLIKVWASTSYAIADAMLAERAK